MYVTFWLNCFRDWVLGFYAIWPDSGIYSDIVKALVLFKVALWLTDIVCSGPVSFHDPFKFDNSQKHLIHRESDFFLLCVIGFIHCSPWASCQIRTIVACACAGNAGNVLALTNGFLWSRWWGKRFRHPRRMHNPQIYLSGKRSMLC